MPLQPEAATILRPLVEGGLALGVGMALLLWAAGSRYFEVIFILGAFGLLVYISR